MRDVLRAAAAQELARAAALRELRAQVERQDVQLAVDGRVREVVDLQRQVRRTEGTSGEVRRSPCHSGAERQRARRAGAIGEEGVGSSIGGAALAACAEGWGGAGRRLRRRGPERSKR